MISVRDWLIIRLFFVPMKNFHPYWDITIANERLQIHTSAWHFWLLAVNVLLCANACHDIGSLCQDHFQTNHENSEVMVKEQSLPKLMSQVWCGHNSSRARTHKLLVKWRELYHSAFTTSVTQRWFIPNLKRLCRYNGTYFKRENIKWPFVSL
jgi:hypothetical protein